jgi:hypothetical protein
MTSRAGVIVRLFAIRGLLPAIFEQGASLMRRRGKKTGRQSGREAIFRHPAPVQ